ncbi:hypothetical protein [Streptomyces sp. NPDC055109]
MATQLETALGSLFAVGIADPDHPPAEVYEAVEGVMAALGSDDIADVVAEGVAAGRISMQQAQAYIGVAVWSGVDNGNSMRRTLDGWLQSMDDAMRVALALHSDIYPLPTRAEMASVLKRVGERFPEHRPTCQYLTAIRPSDSREVRM